MDPKRPGPSSLFVQPLDEKWLNRNVECDERSSCFLCFMIKREAIFLPNVPHTCSLAIPQGVEMMDDGIIEDILSRQPAKLLSAVMAEEPPTNALQESKVNIPPLSGASLSRGKLQRLILIDRNLSVDGCGGIRENQQHIAEAFLRFDHQNIAHNHIRRNYVKVIEPKNSDWPKRNAVIYAPLGSGKSDLSIAEAATGKALELYPNATAEIVLDEVLKGSAGSAVEILVTATEAFRVLEPKYAEMLLMHTVLAVVKNGTISDDFAKKIKEGAAQFQLDVMVDKQLVKTIFDAYHRAINADIV